MKKIDIGQTVAILANMGVIAGIAVLAVELQQNNRLLDAQSSYSLLQHRAAPRWEIFGDSEVAEIMFKVTNGEPLEPLEEFRYKTRLEAEILGLEWEYLQWARGNLEYLPLNQWRRFLNDPGYREMGWEPSKRLLSDEFVEFVEVEILEN